MLTRRQKNVVLAPSTSLRQGDVMLVRVGELPENTKRRKRDKGRVVLAYGEVTGHAHAITEKAVLHFDAENATDAANQLLRAAGFSIEVSDENIPSFLDVQAKAELAHEEHGTIVVTPGKYVVLRKRQYAPEALQTVAD